MTFFAGLDWAATTHAVCVIDETGTVRWRGTVAHTAAGWAELVQRLNRCGPPATLPVALERPSGLVSTPSWRPASPSSPSTPTSSKPADLATPPPGARVIPATPTFSPTSSGPMATASGPAAPRR